MRILRKLELENFYNLIKTTYKNSTTNVFNGI